jgi:hypothetical protein
MPREALDTGRVVSVIKSNGKEDVENRSGLDQIVFRRKVPAARCRLGSQQKSPRLAGHELGDREYATGRTVIASRRA